MHVRAVSNQASLRLSMDFMDFIDFIDFVDFMGMELLVFFAIVLLCLC